MLVQSFDPFHIQTQKCILLFLWFHACFLYLHPNHINRDCMPNPENLKSSSQFCLKLENFTHNLQPLCFCPMSLMFLFSSFIKVIIHWKREKKNTGQSRELYWNVSVSYFRTNLSFSQQHPFMQPPKQKKPPQLEREPRVINSYAFCWRVLALRAPCMWREAAERARGIRVVFEVK